MRTASFGALACASLLAACAVPGPATEPSAIVMSERATDITQERAARAVTIGRSSRADVAGALGETQAIRFDSGYEIWVYRLANTQTGEFLVLFSPAGVVTKTRVRP